MSFEIYLQAFANGAEAGIAADAVRRAFGGLLSEDEPDLWRVHLGGESCDLFLQPLAADESLLHCVSIHRPLADLRMWQAVHELLAIPGTLLHFPGGDAPLARDPRIATAVPQDLLDALGKPLSPPTAADIRAAIENA